MSKNQKKFPNCEKFRHFFPKPIKSGKYDQYMIGRPFLTKKFTKSQKYREKNGKKVVETRKKCIQTTKILIKIP